MIGAEACPGSPATIVRECVRVLAVPQFTDADAGTLRIVSSGLRDCTGSKTNGVLEVTQSMLCHPRCRVSGFTLIELLTTVAIIVVILTLAAPSFTAFQRNSELTGVANTMLSSLTVARSEAMKRGRNTLVVPSADCTTWGDDWTKGWLVFVDNDGWMGGVRRRRRLVAASNRYR